MNEKWGIKYMQPLSFNEEDHYASNLPIIERLPERTKRRQWLDKLNRRFTLGLVSCQSCGKEDAGGDECV